MASAEQSRPASEELPLDILPIIRKSGLLSERQFEDLRRKVLEGSYPNDSKALAQRLVRDRVLTEYQARRILSNKPGGMVVGRYVILDRLGSGAMGRVYKAHHQLMDRTVAIKIIAPEIASNHRVVARFQREMKMVGRLDHPNVVRAYDADQAGDVLYIVMEYVPGRSLGQIFRAEGPLPPLDVARYAIQAARGLGHAHVQGIVHRDIKPSNLLLSDLGQVKVLDLGLGVLMEADEGSNFATADGIAVGTIDYMSPEQACGKEVDGRSDLFSLGCAMYHMITGRLPYPGETPIDRLGKRISGKPVPILEVKPDVHPALAPVLDKMLAHRPSDRFQAAEEAALALEEAIKPRPRPSPSKRVEKGTSPSGAGAALTPHQHAMKGTSSSGAGAAPAHQEHAMMAPSPPQPKIVEVTPEYPFWFRPLARLAELSGAAALLALMALLAVVYAAGFITAIATR